MNKNSKIVEKKAVIFDMDGVISDTEKLHIEVESALLNEYGIATSPEQHMGKYSGISDDEMFRDMFERHSITRSVGEAVRAKWERMHHAKDGRILAIPNAISLIQDLKREGFKLAVASASPKAFIIEVLQTLGVSAYFDAVVSAEDVSEGKPAPDIFLRAADILGILPREIVVIEDGRSGMIGARAAGMACIGLVSNGSSDFPATALVSSLSQIHTDMINNLPVPS